MKKILLVEDDGALGQGGCLALNSESTAITHCKNLFQGRQVLTTADFDLLMLTEPPFNKSHVEVSYLEPNGAPHYFCEPVEGTLPRESTDEMATDTHILALLGVEPEVGAKVTLPITIDCDVGEGKVVEHAFTLSGWWEYDSAIIANHVLIPQSAAKELIALSEGKRQIYQRVSQMAQV